jgi:TPP-dependent pyruvate/acetoin dehydrogenase alpha subunit
VEAKTYRYREHAEGVLFDTLAGYRSQEEYAQWQQRDPIVLFRNYLVREGILDEADAAQLDAEVRAEIAAAVAFARESPYPDPEEAFEGLYTEPIAITR